MGNQYTYDEKLEAIEAVIERWRSALRNGSVVDQELFLILKAIAADYRARNQMRICRASVLMENAIDQAAVKRSPSGNYEPGPLQQIGLLLIGSWPMWRQAMEEFDRAHPPA